MRHFIDLITNPEIITEGAKASYENMIKVLPPEGQTWVRDQFQHLGSIFKRQDRNIWLLRWLRVVWAHKASPELFEKFAKTVVPLGYSLDFAANEVKIWPEHMRSFEHFLSMDFVHDIKTMVFDRQLPKQIISDMKDAEQEWSENQSRTIAHMGGEKKIIDFGNGWAWFDLETPHCSKEASAMGHCGNSPRSGTRDTIFSLRQHVAADHWSPHLTFILRDDGMLTEMKGRNNDKPVAKYHPYILTLLKLPEIKGIVGGGYMPENNFSTSDLPDDEKEALLRDHPHFKDFADMYWDWWREKREAEKEKLPEVPKPDEFYDMLEADLGKRGYRYEDIDPEKDEIILEMRPVGNCYWSTIEKVANEFDPSSSSDTLDRIIAELAEYMGKKNPHLPAHKLPSLADGMIGSTSYYQAYKQALKDACVYLTDYTNSDVYSKLVEGEKQDMLGTFLDIHSYADMVENQEESPIHAPNGDLTEANEYSGRDEDDVIQNMDDATDISHGIIRLALANDDKIAGRTSELVISIYEECDGTATSRTVRDPNQLEFDFMKD